MKNQKKKNSTTEITIIMIYLSVFLLCKILNVVVDEKMKQPTNSHFDQQQQQKSD